jgi:thiol-disulfide isomerase/thioredoxin
VAFAPQLSEALGVGDPIVPLPTPVPAAPSGSARPSPAAAASGAGASGSPNASAQADQTDVVPSDAPSGSAASARPSARSPQPGAFHVGEPAPALSLPLLGGGSVDLASLKGKPVWVNFMATYCPPCRDEFPIMSGFQARYADTGLVVLAVDVREDVATVQEFVGQTGATFPIALDANGAAQKAWGAAALPVHFWIDAQGIVRDGALGGIGPDLMAQSLGRILPGVTVTP